MFKKLLLSLICSITVASSYSQIYFQDYLVATKLDNPYVVFPADLDGDGDMDLIYATNSSDDEIFWFKNIDGQGNFEPQQSIVTNAGSFNSIFAADLDGDGDMDVLSASTRDSKIAWYENLDGLGAFGQQQTIGTPGGGHSVHAGDIDGDGDMDVVAGSYGKITWYENTDSQGDFILKQSRDYQETDTVILHDMDNDSDLDILFGTAAIFLSDKIAWLENTDGKGAFDVEHAISNANDIISLDIADLNNDGNSDLIFASPYGDKVAWHEGIDGLGNFGPEQVITTEFKDPRTVRAADIDGDGDMDIFSCSYDDSNRFDVFNQYRIVWYENLDGNGNFSSPIPISTSRPKADDIYPTDLDNDGDVDLVHTGKGAGANLHWFENTNGDGLFDTEHTIENQWNLCLSKKGAATADIDGDGDNDIVSTFCGTNSESSSILWFENKDGLGDFGPKQTIATNTDYYSTTFSLNDIDQDGDIDIVASFEGLDKVVWYENLDGLGSFGTEQLISNLMTAPRSMHAADMDGDLDIDILIADQGEAKVVWFENTDGAGSFSTENVIGSDLQASFVYVADLNGDGEPDVICASENEDKIVWYENLDGNGTYGTEAIITDISERVLTAFADDFDGDGDLDVLSASIDNTKIAWYENLDGAGSFGTEKVVASSSGSSFTSALSSDLDNDGDIDIVYSLRDSNDGYVNKVAWLENLDGVGNFSEERLIEIADLFLIYEITDLDNDGNMDLLSSELGWYKNLGTVSLQGIEIDVQIEQISCNGASDAAIQVNAGGGEEPYMYELLDENSSVLVALQSDNTFSDLPGGNYIIKVVDAGNREALSNITTVEDPLALSIQNNIINIDCKGANNGSIEVVAMGGTPPYQYQLNGNGFGNSNLFGNLAPNNYTIDIVDSNGCTISINESIIEPAMEFTVSNIMVTDVLCNSQQEGAIEIIVTGGVAPYQYQINNSTLVDSNVFSNLNAGQYEIKARDSLGCELSAIVDVTGPELLTFTSVIVEPTSCDNLNTANVSINVAGGTPPYEYSLDGVSYVSDNDFANVESGLYTIYALDTNGCEIMDQFLVDLASGPDFDQDGVADVCDEDIDGDGVLNEDDQCPSTLLGSTVDITGCKIFTLPTNNYTIQTIAESCISSNNGRINISVIENRDYTATLSSKGNTITSQNFTENTEFSDLQAGDYMVCITIPSEPGYEKCFTLQILEPEPLLVNSIVDPFGKTVTLKLNGGTNYIINLNGEVQTTTESEITIAVTNHSNTLSVKTNKECQGVYEESFLLGLNSTVYPNPVSNGEITISLSSNSEEETLLSLFGSDGRHLLSKTYGNQKLNLALNVGSLPSGMYVLRVNRGPEVYYHKIILR
ncbi:FG-GAP-like repeat-containing protein [Flagellimonas sp.]|uniref:FG-GAP-like repeat-containing protein n=1 Tax=Flagellimonas sp. TaxID=2058762 RepID=UPI003B51ADF2